jgi:hypothetical protein
MCILSRMSEYSRFILVHRNTLVLYIFVGCHRGSIPNCRFPVCRISNCRVQLGINGTCDSSDGKCNCVAGFEGSLCQHNIDDCANMPCEHNGTCTDEFEKIWLSGTLIIIRKPKVWRTDMRIPIYSWLSSSGDIRFVYFYPIFIMSPKIQLCFGDILQY